jgi:Domain of unknown function (DUF4145)
MQTLIAEVVESVAKDDIVFMECPFCRHDIAAAWQQFYSHSDLLGRPLPQFQGQLQTSVVRGTAGIPVHVSVMWLQCQNTQCNEIVVQISRTESGKGTESWIALPKRPNLPVLNQLITDPFRQDYLEAWTILEDSPRMSGVLSRRLLADLLEKYASLKQFSLTSRIDEFIKDTRHPLWIRQNLHYLREVGDFGAHTQQDKTALPTAQPTDPAIINVDKREAEWTLKIIEDLFEYFIVAPQKDKEMREAIGKKLADAQRKPIVPLTS